MFGGADPNALLQMLGGLGGMSGAGAGSPGGAGAGAGFNPFMGVGGGWGAPGGGFGGMGGAASPATPSDTRPPEERFQVQLQVCFAFLPTFLYFFRWHYRFLRMNETDVHCGCYPAIARYGLLERGAECEGVVSNGR